MNIFVIGTSGVGKSTFIKTITEHFGESNFNLVSGGAWVVDLAESIGLQWKNRKERSEKLTELAVGALKMMPKRAVGAIEGRMRSDTINIVDGLRNPGDFVSLFDSHEDILISLVRASNEQEPTKFDMGVNVIHNHAIWMVNNKLMNANQLFNIPLDEDHAVTAKLLTRTIHEAING